jgi:hypothetical protein
MQHHFLNDCFTYFKGMGNHKHQAFSWLTNNALACYVLQATWFTGLYNESNIAGATAWAGAVWLMSES